MYYFGLFSIQSLTVPWERMRSKGEGGGGIGSPEDCALYAQAFRF